MHRPDDGYQAYDALDAAMEDSQDDIMTGFANTEFDTRGNIVSSGGQAPARSPASRPKSVNWSDMPVMDNADIPVNDDAWGEWGSVTPAIRVTPVARSAALLTPPSNTNPLNNRGAARKPGNDSTALSVGQVSEPISQSWQPRSILSRAVSRAFDNTLQSKRDVPHNTILSSGPLGNVRDIPMPSVVAPQAARLNNALIDPASMKQKVAFGRDGFNDGALAFGDLDVHAHGLDDQKYNRQYLEYRNAQLSKKPQHGSSPTKKSNMEITSTIVPPTEILPPVLTSKLLSQGILHYEVVNPAVNLVDAVEMEERRRAQEDFKHMLDMDKVATITETRRPARRLDPTLESTGFYITSQKVDPPSPEALKEKKLAWRAQLEADEANRAHLSFEASRKAFTRRAFTPKGFQYQRNQTQLEIDAKPHRLEALQRGEQKREELRKHREDVIARMTEVAPTSLVDIRKAKQYIGGRQAYYTEKDTTNNIQYEGFVIGEELKGAGQRNGRRGGAGRQ